MVRAFGLAFGCGDLAGRFKRLLKNHTETESYAGA